MDIGSPAGGACEGSPGCLYRGTSRIRARAIGRWAVVVGALCCLADPLAASHSASAPAGATDVAAAAVAPAHASAVTLPHFSRKYATSCSTCHIAPGKLNAEGEAFRLNGYRFPVDDEILRDDDPVPLGAEPWKDLWPDAIWPGELPGSFPLSLHMANDVRVGRQADGPIRVSFRFPQAVHVVSAATLGGGIASYFEVGWRPGSGAHVGEAKIKIQDILPFLPSRALNVWAGSQDLHLITFADPSLDQAARHAFTWQRLSLADWQLRDPTTGELIVSENRFRLSGTRPAIELNGMAAGRFYYGFGLAQPPPGGTGEGHASDVFLKLRYKAGGIGLDGRATAGSEPLAWAGQLLDTGLTLEHFAYFGESSLTGPGETDRHRSFGFAARAVHGRWDLGIGHVRGRNSRPWGLPGQEARHSSLFGRAEYMVYPWVIGSLRIDRTEIRATSPDPNHPGFDPFQRDRLLPGVVMLLRQNVRLIAEGELLLRDRPSLDPERGKPHALWLRLDVAL
jgi:hypothetical protein